MATATLPAGPKGRLLSGNLGELRHDWLGTLTRYAREDGDCVPLRAGARRLGLLAHPDLIESVLVANNRSFIKSPILRRSRLLGRGLLSSDGEHWRRQRRLSQPAFHRQRIAAYGETMVAAAERMLDEWRDGER